MRRSLAIFALMLAGCVEAPPPEPVAGVRDATAPMAATTRFAPERMQGDWIVRYSATQPNLGRLAFKRTEDGYVITDGAGREVEALLTQGARWRDEAGVETWLLWVDADYRTAALGNPDGTVGMILDRSASGGGDRIKAAREIMIWFGYSEGDLT